MCLYKKVKGFTLVELLVTIGIIGIILTISTVSVYTVINNSKNNSNKVAIDNMKKSAGLYVKEYENEVSWQEKNVNEFEACIPLQTLIAKGYLKKDILDNEDIPLSIILIRDEYNNIISEVEEKYDCGTYAKIVQIPTSNDICNNYTYDGNNHFLINPNIQMTDYKEIKYNDTTYKNTNNVLEHPKNAGEYKVSINLAPGKQWNDNTTKEKTVTCKINKKTPDVELSSTGNSDTLENIGTREITLTSEVSGNITIKSSNKNYVTAQVVGTKNITANEKKIIKITTHAQRNSSTSITITVIPTGDYAINYKNGTVTYTVGNIKTKTVDKPTSSICNNLTYNATEQKLAKTNEAYQLINNTAIEIGNYTITARLKYGYMWKDNTTDNVEINCQIKTPEPEVTYKDATCTPESIDVIYGKRYGEKQQLCIPTKIGYTFSGWYSDNSFTKKITNDTIVTNFNNHNLYAKWTANKYIISFDGNGGVVSSTSKEVTYDKTYGTLPDATRTGYTFDGWYTAANGGTEVTTSDKVNITSSITLYAHWTANKYIISFDGNGGVVSSTSKEVTYDKTYDTLPGATRTGYTFDGWYTAANGGSKVTTSDKVNITSNTTLYAHWKPNENTKYVVNHYRMNLDGVNYTLYNVENLMGTTDSSVTPDTQNYTGFTSPKKQTVTILPDGSRVVNYYYSRNSYTITFNANGGSLSTSSKTVMYEGTYGDLPGTNKVGYKFDGWYTASSGGTKIESYNTFTNTSNQTLYAHWSLLFTSQTFEYTGNVQTFTVPITGTYKLEVWGARGGVGTFSYMIETYPGSPLTCAYGSTSIDARANGNASGNFKFNKGDILYVYVGGIGGDGISVSEEAADANCSSSESGTGGYNGGQNGDSESAGSGGATHIALTTGTYTSKLKDSGYILLSAKGGNGHWEGWGGYRIVTANGGGTNFVNTSSSYYVGSAVQNNSDTVTASKAIITLVSANDVIMNKIKYNSNGGSGSVPNGIIGIDGSVLLDSGKGITAPRGKHIASWNTRADGSGTSYALGHTYSLSSDTTLYAIWANHTSSCYSVCGGTLVTPYGSHYVHECQKCGNTSANSYLADEDATPGDECHEHGPCDAKILVCGGTE